MTSVLIERPAGFRRRAFATFSVVILVGIVSHLFRTSPAVVAPDILAELRLEPAWFATITSGYFIAAALTQIPAGTLFDRLGLRATVPALLIIGALGALVFALAQTGAALTLGRVFMGIGCGAVIMAGVVLCARWTSLDQFPVVVGFVLSVSNIGNLLSTAPMALLSAGLGWRGAFVFLAAASAVLALVYLLVVRETPPGEATAQRPKEDFRRALGGSWLILRDRRLWPVFAMAFVGYASIFCIMGVWGGVYLHEAHDLDLVERGYALLAMAIAFALGLFFFGWLARRLRSNKRAVTMGAILAIVPFAVLAGWPSPPAPAATLLFAAVGFAGGFCGTIITHGRAFYPEGRIGRGVTVLNTVVLAGATAFQAASGLLIDMAASLAPGDPEIGYRLLFAALALLLAAGLLVYAWATERPTAERPTAEAAPQPSF